MAGNKNLAEDPYERLANAIILQAVSDYRTALKKIKAHPKNRQAIDEALEIERFFRSGWYQQLTSVDGEYLIRRLQEEIRQSKSIRVKRCQSEGNKNNLSEVAYEQKTERRKEVSVPSFRSEPEIESKIDQIAVLNDLATKATVTYSDMPKSPNRDGSRMEDAIIKIIDLESEINKDMMKLVELKKNIIRRVKAVESAELQTILELRYLSYMRWEEIAIELGYGIDNVYYLHRKALDEIEIPETLQ